MHIKPELRVIGIDDSPLVSRSVLVIGAVMRGSTWLDGVTRTYVEKDGMDATGRLADMISGSKHSGQIRVAMLNGITFGGFNVVDIEGLSERTGLPVIAVMRRRPDMGGIRSALEHLPEPAKRFEMIEKAGPAFEVITAWRGGPVYVQCRGIEKEDAARVVVETAVHSRIPEPVRVAHLIATGVVLGESSRRA